MDLLDAARRTLAEPSARLRVTRGVNGERFTEREVGVTDFALRRTHTRVEVGPWLDELIERHPWMDDGEEHDLPDAERVYAGTAQFTKFGGDWTAHGGQVWAPERAITDPLWILDQLRGEGPRFLLPHHAGEAWTDEQGRIARVGWAARARLRPRAPWPGRPPVHELELFDYGAPVEIEIPPARPMPKGSWLGVAQFGLELLKARNLKGQTP